MRLPSGIHDGSRLTPGSKHGTQRILQIAVKAKASDLHLKAGLPPILRRDGQLVPYQEAGRLTPEIIAKLAAEIMTAQQREDFERNREIDMGYGVPGLGRFRVNVFQQRGTMGMVLRVIPMDVKSIRAAVPAEGRWRRSPSSSAA